MNKQQIEQMAELTKRPEDIVEDIIWHYCKGLMSTDDEQAEKTIKIFAPFLVEWAKENFGQDAGKESEGEAASGEGEKMAEELNRYREDIKEAAGELMVEIPMPGTDLAKVIHSNIMMRKYKIPELKAEINSLRQQLEAGKAPESAALIPTDEELEDMVMDGYAKTDKNKERVRVAKVVRDRIAERFKTIQSNK